MQAGVYYFELGIIGRDIRVHVYLHKTVLFTDNKKSNIKLSEFVYLQQRSIITVKLRGEAHKGSLVIQKYN